MSTKTETAGQKIQAEVSALLRARNALLWVVTNEEGRVERALIETAAEAKYETRLWTCTEGVTDAAGKDVLKYKGVTSPEKVLETIQSNPERAVWILRDYQHFFSNPMVLRKVRSMSRSLPKSGRDEARTIVILTPSEKVPPDLVDHAVVVKWALPDRAEIATILDSVLSGLNSAKDPKASETAAPNGVREAAIEAALGLSAEAAARSYSKCLVVHKKMIVPSVIAADKRAVVTQRGIEWFEPDPRGLAAVGGLELLKLWLTQRRNAFSQRARDYGLPMPKGVLVVGLPGTGKSLVAKATAAAWGVPLLRFDAGAQKAGIVGESERNVRAAYAIAEAVGNCVLWFDEIEKMFGGADGSNDGGVSKDALAVFLQWMQEKKGSVFVVATANDVRQLPPEMLRKGRFDEMFFVDLPTRREREEILRVTLAQHKRDKLPIDVEKLVTDSCRDFTGAEVASIVESALYAAFDEGEREITTEDLAKAAASVVPLVKSAADKIEGLRKWSEGRARRASKTEEGAAVAEKRDGGLDFDADGPSDPHAN